MTPFGLATISTQQSEHLKYFGYKGKHVLKNVNYFKNA